jgi:hypothetical protein
VAKKIFVISLVGALYKTIPKASEQIETGFGEDHIKFAECIY